MRAELLKVRYLPTPRNTAAVVLGLTVVVFILLFLLGNDKAADYTDSVEIVETTFATLGAVVIGVWMVGLEYGQGTLRRTLTADPRRAHLIVAKVAVAIATVAALTIATALLAAVLFSLAAKANGAATPFDDAFRVLPGALFANFLYVAIGIGVALLARSMAGGMTAMLALLFVVDGALSAISGVEKWTIGTAIDDFVQALSNRADGGSLPHAALVIVLWSAVIIGGGWYRFTRSDVP
jgi:ABC-2 type transport system permease protein